jgi:hypothetical protein
MPLAGVGPVSWDAIGAIGEIVGALAVVISLLYLSGQVRHNNRLAKNSSLQSVLQSEMNFASIIIEHAELWDRLIAGESFESRAENRQATILFNLYLLDSANRYYVTTSIEPAIWKIRPGRGGSGFCMSSSSGRFSNYGGSRWALQVIRRSFWIWLMRFMTSSAQRTNVRRTDNPQRRFRWSRISCT